ncbi:hypothetical protein SAMN04487769_1932 [Burkholderia sp. b14]|nr:hypothetical protein SAMN04487769_1932 [Burkholderia sp. b14]
MAGWSCSTMLLVLSPWICAHRLALALAARPNERRPFQIKKSRPASSTRLRYRGNSQQASRFYIQPRLPDLSGSSILSYCVDATKPLKTTLYIPDQQWFGKPVTRALYSRRTPTGIRPGGSATFAFFHFRYVQYGFQYHAPAERSQCRHLCVHRFAQERCWQPALKRFLQRRGLQYGSAAGVSPFFWRRAYGAR